MLSVVALRTNERLVVRHGRTFSDAELTFATHPRAELTWMHGSIPMQTAQMGGLGLRSDNPRDAPRLDSAYRRNNFQCDRPGRHPTLVDAKCARRRAPDRRPQTGCRAERSGVADEAGAVPGGDEAGAVGGGDDRGENDPRSWQMWVAGRGRRGGQARPLLSTALPVPAEVERLVAHADRSFRAVIDSR
jgi:hypothetical protein